MTVIDDYAHHPTESKTTLQAIKAAWPDRRVVGVFQPHRYTRTRALGDEFTRAFYQTDKLVLVPIYAASEKPIAGVTHTALCEGIQAHGHKNVICTADFDEALRDIRSDLRDDDIILTMGAGDIFKLGERLLEQMQDPSPPSREVR